MTQHEDPTPEGVEPSAESAEGSEGVTNAPGPQADQQESDLTVEDILNAAQSEAAQAEGAEAAADAAGLRLSSHELPRPPGTSRPRGERRRQAGLLARGSRPVRVAFPEVVQAVAFRTASGV